MNKVYSCLSSLVLCFGLCQSLLAAESSSVMPAAQVSTTTSAAAATPTSAPTGSALAESAPSRMVAEDEEDASLPALDSSVVKDVIVSHMASIKYCYDSQLKKDPDLAGKVVVKFTVGPKGAVTKADVKETTLKNKDVETCMVGEVKSWIFPEPRRGESVDIAFPFVFKPST